MPDPRWLEILKASGWQLLAIAVACSVFLLAERWSWIPSLEPWVKQLAFFALVTSTALWIASIGSALTTWIPPKVWINHWRRLARDRRETRKYIPHMTADERAIVAYLLAKNQKTFVAPPEAGKAVTLVARRIVVRALLPGQVFAFEEVPFAIPDHVWKVLDRYRDQFPYDARGEDDRALPWY